jgi:hypothetical protein
MLGYIPDFLTVDSPLSAVEQLHRNYQHGGGWKKFDGFALLANGNLKYPGDPETRLLAEAYTNSELVRIYEHSWVAVVQIDGSFEVARMD